MKLSKILNSPILLPILFFVFVILLGSALLHGLEKNVTDALSWTDAVFTATSAACVTGLVVKTASVQLSAWWSLIQAPIFRRWARRLSCA